MKTSSKVKAIALTMTLAVLTCISCKKENLNDPMTASSSADAGRVKPNTNPGVSGFGAMTIKLVDGGTFDPYAAVNVEIVGAMANYENGGWRKLQINQGIYNLEQWRNHVATLSSNMLLPAGKILEIRLLLGTSCTVVTHEVGFKKFHRLYVPDRTVTIKVGSNVVSGKDMNIILDFEANNSVSAEGNAQDPAGTFILYPSVKVRDVIYTPFL